MGKRCPRDLGSDLEDLKIWKDGEEWNQRWDIIMPYYIDGAAHLMFHDKDSKSYAWARVNDEANDITDVRQDRGRWPHRHRHLERHILVQVLQHRPVLRWR